MLLIAFLMPAFAFLVVLGDRWWLSLTEKKRDIVREYLDYDASGFPKAIADLMTLESVAERYRVINGQYPLRIDIGVFRQTLPFGEINNELAAEFVAGEMHRQMRDPWGSLYHYDPAGERNGGQRPDIWTNGPPDAEPSRVIGNWMFRKGNVDRN